MQALSLPVDVVTEFSMVRLSTIVIILAIVLAIGLIPIPVIPGVGLLVGISGIILGIILRLIGW
ncbi:hypothetical protein SAMN04487967_0038 [Natronorubrum sediminis]|uniref:Uncharacterized protein n=2 Tax=Natronorubrum TaxID=134813 RepID=A0A1N6X7F7_9EURY|nr:hypothetical protein SAMN04487967_0038 [Natronorubrum sediminis]SIQ98278.1 hypothetical protein SAMN05421809_0035 [Natronorubrum daqingense]